MYMYWGIVYTCVCMYMKVIKVPSIKIHTFAMFIFLSMDRLSDCCMYIHVQHLGTVVLCI